MRLTSQHRPKVLNKLVIHQNIGEHLIKLVIRNALLLLLLQYIDGAFDMC